MCFSRSDIGARRPYIQDEQDRIRKRIREDVRDAISAHNEYAENTLPRLKRNYLKKCQEAEVCPLLHVHSARWRRISASTNNIVLPPLACTGLQVCRHSGVPRAHFPAGAE